MIELTLLAAALSAPAGPSCSLTSTIGCFVDTNTARVLPSSFKAPALPASLEACASLVAATVGSAAMPTTVLGVEAGKQCWWGPDDRAANRTAVPDQECGTPCAGNASETCGGDWRIRLYKAACTPWKPPPPPPPPPPPQWGELSVVFAAGDCDENGECYPCFRIPAIKHTKSGSLIAFAEARGGLSGSCSDHGDVKVVSRTSSDGTGANGTWGPISVVANETGHTLGNPSPVVDASGTGRIFCHFARDNNAAFVAHSSDDGKTWSPRTALDVKVPGTGWYGSGVGGGIELTSSASASASASTTLMILAEERLGPAFNAVPITSSNGGVSWARGPWLNDANNASHGLGEPSVAIVPGGSDTHLIASGRGAKGPAFISWSHSLDGGKVWSPSATIAAVTSPGCQAPIVGVAVLPDKHGGGVGAMITSPSGPGRRNLGAFVASAASGFKDWSLAGMLATPGVHDAGYSSLLRSDTHGHGHGRGQEGTASATEYLVLVETTSGAGISNGHYSLWLNRFTL